MAVLSGGDSPKGTISWKVYSAGDTRCSSPLNSSVLKVSVTGNGTYTSPDFTASSPGSYQWVATYSGDSHNYSVSTGCNDKGETSWVSPATPAITTNAASGTAGGSIHDTATLSGGFNPTGTISWNLYRASDTTCSTPLNASPLTVAVSGDGTYQSPDFGPASAEGYQWVATYQGDGNNNQVASQCNDPYEVSTVSQASPTIATNATSGTGSVHDVATVSGGFNPTGTISWNVYSTGDRSCSTPLNKTSITAAVNGDGQYTSPGFTAGPGSYQWVATYMGDGNNSQVASQCNDPSEVSTVGTPPAPGLQVLKLQRVGSSG
ncbi:MAG: hypothetical protein JO244_02675, partial [Solirubrobacterales bacterium]|nr:hypothetical protein [Solirubrobacterales bacterium]